MRLNCVVEATQECSAVRSHACDELQVACYLLEFEQRGTAMFKDVRAQLEDMLVSLRSDRSSLGDGVELYAKYLELGGVPDRLLVAEFETKRCSRETEHLDRGGGGGSGV